MTNRRRGLLVGLFLAGAALASLATAAVVMIQRLPDPETADRRGLIRWLIERDLREQPWDLRLRLVSRVEQELLAGVDLREVAALLNADQCRRLVKNGDELARVWFVREADHYAAARQDQRPSLLDQQLKHVQRLGIMDQLAAVERWAAARTHQQASLAATALAKPTSQPSATGSFAANTERIERWVSETVPAERAKLQEFFTAIRTRMVLETFRSWLPIGSRSN
jgi:hypothetical protein